jgi:hypothetical protein
MYFNSFHREKGNAFELYSEGLQIESRSEYRLSWIFSADLPGKFQDSTLN